MDDPISQVRLLCALVGGVGDRRVTEDLVLAQESHEALIVFDSFERRLGVLSGLGQGLADGLGRRRRGLRKNSGLRSSKYLVGSEYRGGRGLVRGLGRGLADGLGLGRGLGLGILDEKLRI